jgi:hypothetical protein
MQEDAAAIAEHQTLRFAAHRDDIGAKRWGFAKSGFRTTGIYHYGLHIGCLFPRASAHAG